MTALPLLVGVTVGQLVRLRSGLSSRSRRARCGMMRRLWHPLVDLAGAEIVSTGRRSVNATSPFASSTVVRGFNHVDIPVDELVIR